MYKGSFISFEGIDGSGKSTQVKELQKYLVSKGHEVLGTVEPGGSSIGVQVRDIILSGKYSILPETETMLLFADRYEHQKKIIIPALEKGQIVISDRTQDSTYAYQGSAKGVDYELISELEKKYLILPDLTFFLDLTVDAAFERTAERKSRAPEKNNTFDAYNKGFYEKVIQGYHDLFSKHLKRVFTVNAAQDVGDVTNIIIRKVDEFFRNRRT